MEQVFVVALNRYRIAAIAFAAFIAFVGAVILRLLGNFAHDFTDRYTTLIAVFIIALFFAPAGIAGIGKQVRRAIEGSLQKPSAAQPTGEAITKGKQQ